MACVMQDDSIVATAPDETARDALCVAALYQFTRFSGCEAVRDSLLRLCRAEGVRGTLLLAQEGINGTIAGRSQAIGRVLDHIRALPGCSELDVKFSAAATMPFHRLKVRIKPEIVTMGEPGIDPMASAGTYVAPQDWNALITDPNTIVIDTRNDYEVAIGSFADAISPNTTSFREFPAWFRSERDKLLGEGRQPKVAMYCTGGIRCEKSTTFLKREGLEEVFHLRGGILKYLEEIPEPESLWRGECFVFDQRVSVSHGLKPGSHVLCPACRRPVNEEGLASPFYEEGVSCEGCYHQRTDAQRAGYRERHRQEALAAAMGRSHIGDRQPASDTEPSGHEKPG